MSRQYQLLGSPYTMDYIPTVQHSYYWQMLNRQPPFTLWTVIQMLTDPRINFGLWLLKGPIISKSKFFIRTERADVKEFLIENITRFWRNSASRALKALEWGYSCSEVLYRLHNGKVQFNTLKDLHPLDCKAITLHGSLVGAQVDNVPLKNRVALPGMKAFWHVHQREYQPYYGRSRLFGAYRPWIELWLDGGFRQSRRLFFHKYAFDGGILYHPPGASRVNSINGSVALTKSNKDLAREMLEKKKAGGTLTLPNSFLANTNARQWEYVPPNSISPPAGLMEYGQELKDEELEGMGIPPEVIRSSEGILGDGGRRVVQEAFYATLQEMVNWLIFDADEQIFRKLVVLPQNFGPGADDYEIVPFGLMQEADKSDQGQGEEDDQGEPVPSGSGTPDNQKTGSLFSIVSDTVFSGKKEIIPMKKPRKKKEPRGLLRVAV